MTLPNAILLSLAAGLLFGILLGATGLLRHQPWLGQALGLGGDLFKQLIQMVVLPLVIFSLIVGMMSLGDLSRLGRVAGKTLLLYACTALLACVLAVVLANLVAPGRALPKESRDRIAAEYRERQEKMVRDIRDQEKQGFALDGWTFVRSLVPANIFKAVAQGQMLPVIFFSLLFGLTAALLESGRRDRLLDTFGALNDVMVRMVGLVMWTAPVGVFCMIAASTATLGLAVFPALGLYCVVVVAGLLLQLFAVYRGVIKSLTKLPFLDFLRASRPALITAFGTSSSAASLPVNMECVSRRLGVSDGVTRFVLPIGTTVNMDGTAIMQSVATIFLAQIYSIELGVTAQILIILTAMLASVGTAPVPSAGIAMLVLILEPLQIPLEGLALIWAVDRPLDMLRTVVNVAGDGVAAAVVASSEGEPVRYHEAA